MSGFALWLLAQAPASIPDLVWWILGLALALLNAVVAIAARLVWVLIDERLKRLEKWQEDHSP